MMAHHEKMKQHRNNLEKRVAECEKSSGQLAVEDELRELKDSKKKVEESLVKAENRWGDPGLPVSAGRGGQQR